MRLIILLVVVVIVFVMFSIILIVWFVSENIKMLVCCCVCALVGVTTSNEGVDVETRKLQKKIKIPIRYATSTALVLYLSKNIINYIFLNLACMYLMLCCLRNVRKKRCNRFRCSLDRSLNKLFFCSSSTAIFHLVCKMM